MPTFSAYSNDGYTYSPSTVWSSARNQVAAAVHNTSDILYIYSSNDPSKYVHRINIPFDTSAVGANVVQSVRLALRVLYAGASGQQFSLVVSPLTGGAALTTSNGLLAGWGSVSAGGASSCAVGDNLDLAVDTAVIPVVTDGYTHIGIREAVHDIPNVEPSLGTTVAAGFASASHATVAYRPVLTIEYASAATGKPFFYFQSLNRFVGM